MRFQLVLLIMAATLFRCKKPIDSNIQMTVTRPVPNLIDTFNHQVAERYETWLTTANYDFLYIGKYRHELAVDYQLRFYEIPPPPPGTEVLDESLQNNESDVRTGYYLHWLADRKYRTWEIANIEIMVDNSRIIKNEDISVDSMNPYFNANPVMITNQEFDTIMIGYGSYLPIIMEAKDSLGAWRPIEKTFTYMCGNGVGSILLPPDEIVITSAIIYHGNYETDLRLKIGKNYSKPYKGKINYRQFESRFNDAGNYKAEYLEENSYSPISQDL